MINISIFQRITVAVICILGVLYALPNVLPENTFEDLPEGMPGKTINLGLDLRGGLHLLMKVETDVFRSSTNRKSSFRKLFRGA